MKLETIAKRAPAVVIAAAVLLAYWPLATFGHTLPHGDTLDCWLPWRFFIASCLHNGELPLWNPLLQMGYPVHADLQGPAWYVEALALGGTVGQPVWLLQALFLGYVIVGGAGMHRVVRTVHGHDCAAVLMGVAYALGGFFTGHTMHFYSVISAAWLPWMLDAQLRLLRAPHWRPALAAAVFQSFLLTGGNQTFTILAAYLVFTLVMAQLWAQWPMGRGALLRVLRYEGLFVLATVAMACGTLCSAVEVIPWMTRGAGVDLATASEGAFTWRSCISLLMPFATGTDRAVLGTDPTMANGYMGVWVLAWAMLALFRERTRTENVLLGFGLVCGLAALGPALPVHRLLWSYLPGFDLFRFPSYLLWGAQFATIVLAGGTLVRWPALLGRRRGALLVVGALCAAVLVLVLLAIASPVAAPVEGGLFAWLRSLATGQRVLLNALVLLPVMLAGAWLILRRRSGPRPWGALLLLEMIWSTGLAAWNTSLADLSPFAVQARIDAYPPGPVRPPLEPMALARDDAAGLQVLWRNTQVFKGRTGFGGFNSFQLKHTADLLERHPALRDALLERPLLFLGDPLATPPPGEVTLTAFSYGSLEALVRTPRSVTLNVQQAWYPGWTGEVDGVEVPLRGLNVAGFGLQVPPGVHRVRFTFRKPWAPVLLAVSLGALFLALLALAWTSQRRRARLPVVLVLMGLSAFALFAHGPRSAEVERGLRTWDSAGRPPDIVSTDVPEQVRDHLPQALVLRCERATDVPALVRAFAKVEGPHAELALAGLPLPREALPVLDERGWHLERRTRFAGVEVLRFVRQLEGAEGPVLHADPLNGGQVLVSPGSPYTAAYRQRIGDLEHVAGDRLCVDLRYKAASSARGYVVIERRRGGRTVDYEAVPFVADGDTGWAPFMVLRDRSELRDPEAELGIYAWNEGGDTIRLRDLRVRMVGGPRVKDGD